MDQIIAERSAVPAQGRYVNKLSKPVYGEISKLQQQKINQMAKRKLKQTPKPKAKKAKKSYDMWNDDEGKTPLFLLCKNYEITYHFLFILFL